MAIQVVIRDLVNWKISFQIKKPNTGIGYSEDHSPCKVKNLGYVLEQYKLRTGPLLEHMVVDKMLYIVNSSQ